jgi:hypothetical protein
VSSEPRLRLLPTLPRLRLRLSADPRLRVSASWPPPAPKVMAVQLSWMAVHLTMAGQLRQLKLEAKWLNA